MGLVKKLECRICGKELEEGSRIRLSWNEELLRKRGKINCRTWCGMNRVIYLCEECAEDLWNSF